MLGALSCHESGLWRRVAGCWLLSLCGASIQPVALSLCSLSLHCWTASPTHPVIPPACTCSHKELCACRLHWLWLFYLWIFTPHSPHTQPFEASTSHRESEKYSHHIPTFSNTMFTPSYVSLSLCLGRVCACNASVNLTIKKAMHTHARTAACEWKGRRGGGWQVVGLCGGVMENHGGVSVACVWECCVGPLQVVLVAHVGGRAGPGSVPCSVSLLNRIVWEDHHVIKTVSLGVLWWVTTVSVLTSH